MPTLLRSNAAAGVAMGLDSHLKELDRTEAQRQFDMGRHDKARLSHAGLISELIKNPGAALATIPDGKGGTTNLGNLAQTNAESFIDAATPGRWFNVNNGVIQAEDPRTIYDASKKDPVTLNSRYKSKRIIEGK